MSAPSSRLAPDRSLLGPAWVGVALLGLSACGTGGTAGGSGGNPPTGGVFGTGGASMGSGGSNAGQSSTGGGAGASDTAGGSVGTGGTGGPSSGGTGASGGTASSSGGASSGGAAPSGGGGSSGGSVGGSSTGGSGASGGVGAGRNFEAPFFLGADISGTQESNATYVDTDGQTKSIFEVLKNHGFNYIRLRTFVDPLAPYGYASAANDCQGKAEAYGDKAHVIEYGKRAKDLGMGFLLDFHYSDVWADPGNQIIPDAWRGARTIDELAAFAKDYTKEVIADAIAAGARPDMVQVGNEITPGVMIHIPGPNTDCWGNNPQASAIGGSASNWDNLATLLKAGIAGVREVDPTIQVMLHIENTDNLNGVRSWVSSALSRGVDFDILGLSCYTAFQGQPSVWQNTFSTMASEFPELSFVIAEYNPARTEANMLMKNLPEGRGLGAFFWEPTSGGEWGDAMFTRQGGSFVANSADFAEFDGMRGDLGL